MDDYTPIPLLRLDLNDAIAASAVFKLSGYARTKIGSNKDFFMYFLDTKSLFNLRGDNDYYDGDGKVANVKGSSEEKLFDYMNDLKELMKSYLKIDEQIQKYDFQNRLMNKDLGVGKFGKHINDKYGFNFGGKKDITYEEHLKTTVLGEIQQQYESFTNAVCEYALGLTHIFYWKNNGRMLEHRPGRILDKCFKRALNLVQPMINSFNDELVKEYGHILDGVYEIEKVGLQK